MELAQSCVLYSCTLADFSRVLLNKYVKLKNMLHSISRALNLAANLNSYSRAVDYERLTPLCDCSTPLPLDAKRPNLSVRVENVPAVYAP